MYAQPDSLVEMHARLEAYLRAGGRWPSDLSIEGLTLLSSGWESDVYGFDLAVPGQEAVRLALRLYFGGFSAVKAGQEFAGMRLLHHLGYPVPQPLLAEPDGSRLGRAFLIMQRIEGEPLWPVMERAPEPERDAYFDLFCELMVRLHRLHVPPNARPAALPWRPLGEWGAHERSLYAMYPLASFEPVLDWLEARMPSRGGETLSLIHLDLHPANVLLWPNRAGATVIDWTQAQFADYRLDLAWTLVLAGSQRSWSWRDRILAGYEASDGRRVQDLAWFEAVACTRRLLSVALSLRYGPETLGMRPGAQAAMVQRMEPLSQVYGLLRDRTGMRIPEVEEMLAGG